MPARDRRAHSLAGGPVRMRRSSRKSGTAPAARRLESEAARTVRRWRERARGRASPQGIISNRPSSSRGAAAAAGPCAMTRPSQTSNARPQSNALLFRRNGTEATRASGQRSDQSRLPRERAGPHPTAWEASRGPNGRSRRRRTAAVCETAGARRAAPRLAAPVADCKLAPRGALCRGSRVTRSRCRAGSMLAAVARR